MTRMKKKYLEEVAPALMEKFQYKSTMQIPRLDKIVVSVGCGDCKDNAKALEAVIKEISNITHQSINSINTARTRLRKKLNLSGDDTSLVAFLDQFDTKKETNF